MEVVYERCCGVDVHKRTITACLKVGKERELRAYGTQTGDLREMAKWLLDAGCEMVAMESTGAYWKPVYNILEVLGLEAMVVNAQHMRAVPGRKTDMKDAEWIADLLQHGLLKASYIPNKEQRELREISRYRKSLVEERSREINRLEKTLEGANFKLSSVVSELTGRSSRSLINAFVTQGITDGNIDSMLFGSLQGKREELLKACDGVISKVQKRLVLAIINHIDDMTRRIQEMDELIEEEMQRYEEARKRIDDIPGIGINSAQTILAEIGMTMEQFPSAAHLASWSGLSPGNNESAGKRKSARTCPGNKTLKTTMVQCAKSASRTKGSFFKAQYDRLVVRRGANRATVAVAHSMLIAIYHMLKNNTPFHDRGEDFYNHFNKERKIAGYLKKLDALGWSPSHQVMT